MEEASNSKRKPEDEGYSSSKRSKLQNDQNFSFSESSNDSVDFLKLDQNCVKISDVLESSKVLSNSGDGDNSNDSVDFLKLADTNIGEQSIGDKECNVESCSTNNSNNVSSMNNKSIENGESSNMQGTDGMQSRTSTDILQTEAENLQAMENVLSDLVNSNKTSMIKSEESTEDTVKVKTEGEIQPKKEVLSDVEDEPNLIDMPTINTASGSGEVVPKREILSDSENENEPIKTKKKVNSTKIKKQTNEDHRAKLKAMLDSSDEDEVAVEVDEITAIVKNEVDDQQQSDDVNKNQSTDTNCATTSGTNDRIFRERCWYGPSCFRYITFNLVCFTKNVYFYF